MQELAGSLQSLCWASAAVGGVASAYFSGAALLLEFVFEPYACLCWLWACQHGQHRHHGLSAYPVGLLLASEDVCPK